MAKAKKTIEKKKERVKALTRLGKTITKMVSQNNDLMTSIALEESVKKAEPIDSIEKLETIIGMEPPKETLWCRTIDVTNGNIMNDGCNTVVVLSNDRTTVDGVAMTMHKANGIMKTDLPVLIPYKLLGKYDQFVHDTHELVERTYKMPKSEKIDVDIYSVLAYMFMTTVDVSDNEYAEIMASTMSITKIRTSLSADGCGNYLFIDLDECVLELGTYNEMKKCSNSYQYTKRNVADIYNNMSSEDFQHTDVEKYMKIVSAKVHLPIYRIEKDKRIRIGYMEVTASGNVVAIFDDGNPHVFIDNFMNCHDANKSFRITDFALNVTSYASTREKHLYIPLGCIILNENEYGDTATVQKIIRDVSRYWTSLV